MASKSVLITGCSEGGIGDALAREFHARGLTVFATARNVAKMSQLKGLGVYVMEMDVTLPESIAKAAEVVGKATDGKLDLLINNAGMSHAVPFADCKPDDLKRVLDTNVFGVFAVTHAFLPLVIAARGTIAGIGSVNKFFNPPWQTAYNASKLALEGFLSTLRLELAPFGVRVVTVITGAVKTHLFDNTDTRTKVPEGSLYYPLKDRIERHEFLEQAQWQSPEDYAKQVADDLLGKNCPSVIWRGGGAMLFRILNMFGWSGMLDSVISKRFGLDTLKPPSA